MTWNPDCRRTEQDRMYIEIFIDDSIVLPSFFHGLTYIHIYILASFFILVTVRILKYIFLAVYNSGRKSR